ncbi:MAG: N-acetylmuramoyl-L-alanine amidase [Pseudomonadota bacterium]
MNRLLRQLILVLCLVYSGVSHADIHDVKILGDGVNTRIVIAADSEISHQEFVTSGSGASLVVDVADKPWVGEDRVYQPMGGVTSYNWVNGQLVFWLDSPMLISRTLDLPPYGARTSHRVIIDLISVSQNRFERVARQDMQRLASLESERRLSSAESPRRVAAGGQQYVIVVDPGHGGRDPGASHHGAVERAIVLSAGKRLKTILEGNPRYQVRLTREDDRFIELEDRVTLARNWGADLFISLHADAASKPDIRGATVYTLSAKGERRVDSMAERYNWELPIETGEAPDEVAGILEDFLKRETKTNSETFASLLIPELAEAGPILRNTHRNENFFVLLAPDVPAVLLEMGFLTNREDARRLSTADGQRRVMVAVADAIDAYFDQQEVLLAQN